MSAISKAELSLSQNPYVCQATSQDACHGHGQMHENCTFLACRPDACPYHFVIQARLSKIWRCRQKQSRASRLQQTIVVIHLGGSLWGSTRDLCQCPERGRGNCPCQPLPIQYHLRSLMQLPQRHFFSMSMIHCHVVGQRVPILVQDLMDLMGILTLAWPYVL